MHDPSEGTTRIAELLTEVRRTMAKQDWKTTSVLLLDIELTAGEAANRALELSQAGHGQS